MDCVRISIQSGTFAKAYPYYICLKQDGERVFQTLVSASSKAPKFGQTSYLAFVPILESRTAIITVETFVLIEDASETSPSTKANGKILGQVQLDLQKYRDEYRQENVVNVPLAIKRQAAGQQDQQVVVGRLRAQLSLETMKSETRPTCTVTLLHSQGFSNIELKKLRFVLQTLNNNAEYSTVSSTQLTKPHTTTARFGESEASTDRALRVRVAIQDENKTAVVNANLSFVGVKPGEQHHMQLIWPNDDETNNLQERTVCLSLQLSPSCSDDLKAVESDLKTQRISLHVHNPNAAIWLARFVNKQEVAKLRPPETKSGWQTWCAKSFQKEPLDMSSEQVVELATLTPGQRDTRIGISGPQSASSWFEWNASGGAECDLWSDEERNRPCFVVDVFQSSNVAKSAPTEENEKSNNTTEQQHILAGTFVVSLDADKLKPNGVAFPIDIAKQAEGSELSQSEENDTNAQKLNCNTLSGTARAWNDDSWMRLVENVSGISREKTKILSVVESKDLGVEKIEEKPIDRDLTLDKSLSRISIPPSPVASETKSEDKENAQVQRKLSNLTENIQSDDAHIQDEIPKSTPSNELHHQEQQVYRRVLAQQEEALSKQDQLIADQARLILELRTDSKSLSEKNGDLTLTLSQRDSTIELLVQDVNERSDALRICGEEVVQLRQTTTYMEQQMNDLRSAGVTFARDLNGENESDRAATARTSQIRQMGEHAQRNIEIQLDDKELNSASSSELKEMVSMWHGRCALEAKRGARAMGALGRVNKLRVGYRAAKQRVHGLEIAAEAQARCIQELQEDIRSVERYKRTVETQESVIERLEQVIEHHLETTVKNGSNRRRGGAGDNKELERVNQRNRELESMLAQQRGSELAVDVSEKRSSTTSLDIESMTPEQKLERILELEDQLHNIEASVSEDHDLADQNISKKDDELKELEEQLIGNAKAFAKDIAQLRIKVMEFEASAGNSDSDSGSDSD